MTSSLLSQIAGSPSAASQFATGLNQLAKDLQSGNLSAAQQDYVTLSQDALDGATTSSATTSAGGITPSLLSEIASSSSSANSFASAFNQLGADLASGDLTSADGDMLSLDSTALNAVPSSNAASSSPSNKADITALIQATTQAMEVGDDSAISADMSRLASASSSSTGAGYLQSDSESYGASSGSGSSPVSGGSSSANSISQLLQSVNADNSSNSGSTLSLLA